MRVAIKCPVPRQTDAKFWGDHYLAQSLGRALTRLGCRVRIEIVPQWYDGGSRSADLVIVLRGLTAYRVNRCQLNFCWVISHPKQVTDAELETYDHVFVASMSYAELLRARLKVPVDALLQCSDPEIFHPPSGGDDSGGAELLFVGNSRLQMRKIVKDCLDQRLPLTVHGRQWEGLIPPHMVRSQHVPNAELHRHYGKANIVLNDHWGDMARHGFVSNRIFDVGLSGGFVISDQFVGSEIFDGTVVTYKDAPELARLCRHWLGDEQARRKVADCLRQLVLDAHTFDRRARVIADTARCMLENLRSAGTADPRNVEMKRLKAENRRARSWLRPRKNSVQRVERVRAELRSVEEALRGQPEVMALAGALVRLQSSFDRFLGARRWQIANQIGRGIDVTLRRPKGRPPADFVRDVLAAFAQWKDDIVAAPRSPYTSQDADQLAKWLGKLDGAFQSIIQSRRWRFINAIGRLYDLAPSRLREPFVTEELREIFLEARRERFDAAIAPTIRSTSFGRMLARIPADDFPVALAERLVESEASLAAKAERMRNEDGRPLVSIIMPTYDRAAVIRQAIESVVEQHYSKWELFICDDGSRDNTEDIVGRFADPRISYLKLPRRGGSAARNAGMARARGSIFAYLDSDNIWHPSFLSAIVAAIRDNPGRSAVYCDYIDFQVDKGGQCKVLSFARPAFNHEQLLHKNFIDLNSFAHHRELYDCFGGFDERLTRRQDYDLILKYTWLCDPVYVPCIVALYQRNQRLIQVTQALRHDNSCVPIIEGNIAGYFRRGLPCVLPTKRRKVTVLSWDLCRDHFSKPIAVAEALAKDHDVQLVAFNFFDKEISVPLKDVISSFETVYLPGGQFPDFFDTLSQAVGAIRGDVVYVVEQRLPSLGLALLANHQSGIPIIFENRNLGTVDRHTTDGEWARLFDTVDPADPRLITPHSDLWGQIMDTVAESLPLLVTNNATIGGHFAHKCLYIRNVKDEEIYDPACYDRNRVRSEFGFTPRDRVIICGGIFSRHNGIHELIELVKRLGDSYYKFLIVGEWPTPDQERLMRDLGNAVRLMPALERETMARVHLAADLVITWLEPHISASHHQMPHDPIDALAMGVPLIANDAPDFGDLGRQGYLRVVPFGDWEALMAAVRDILEHPEKAIAMREAGRRMFLRQLSYAATRSSFALTFHRAETVGSGPLLAAERFAEWFEKFRAVAGRDNATAC